MTPDMPPPPPPTTFEGILKPENVAGKDVNASKKGEKVEKKTEDGFWGALLASATRRRSITPSSPLVLSRSLDDVDDAKSKPENEKKDADGDTVMTSPTKASQKQQQLNFSSSSPLVPTTLTDIIARTKTKRSRSKSKSKRSRNRSSSPQRPDPVLDVLSAAAAIGQFDFGFNLSPPDSSNPNLGFAPLERVRSRDSGYHSKSTSVASSVLEGYSPGQGGTSK